MVTQLRFLRARKFNVENAKQMYGSAFAGEERYEGEQ